MATSGRMKSPDGLDDVVYLSEPSQWDALVLRIKTAVTIGLDSEFYGLDVRKQSCVGRAKIHVWSVATRTTERSPLGFHRARGWVMPAEALDHRGLRRVLEDWSIEKCIHNQPDDDHALHNHGVQLRGAINTLDLARWAWPELVTEGGFRLKNLMGVKLRRPPIAEFKDVVGDTRTIRVSRTKRAIRNACACGVVGCRLRREREGVSHLKRQVEEDIVVTTDKVERFQHPLESIVPGHTRWELLVRYAAEDAVAALEIAELAEAESNPAPWVYGGTRPGYNQDVADQVVLMERTGFRVDTAYAAEAATRAEADEETELEWLHRWYAANAPHSGPHRREETDAVWTSVPKRVALFDQLGFPRSPIWKKGRVKPGEVKMDGAAMEWIAKNHPPARQLLKHLLRLQRVRSGKNYLIKMRDCGGFINPVCGAAGDSDDRNGAVTGRLGIKGVLPSQQLPKRGEVDLYHVRKGIIP